MKIIIKALFYVSCVFAICQTEILHRPHNNSDFKRHEKKHSTRHSRPIKRTSSVSRPIERTSSIRRPIKKTYSIQPKTTYSMSSAKRSLMHQRSPSMTRKTPTLAKTHTKSPTLTPQIHRRRSHRQEDEKQKRNKDKQYYNPKLKKPYYTPSKFPNNHHHHHHNHHHNSNSYRPYYYQNRYYPYYTFYWYNYDFYRPFFGPYYHYYLTHGFPFVNYYGPLIFFSGQQHYLNSQTYSSLNNVSLKLKQCSNGPEYYFTVRVRGKVFRVFLGDVNDFFNVQCLYMMNAVISIGKMNYAKKVLEIFRNPSKTIEAQGKSIHINPFKNSKHIPENVNLVEISNNMKEISFDLKDHSLPTKNIVFYHKNHVDGFDYEDIFREIGSEADAGNVLFVIDQFQKQSVQVFRHFLVTYRRYTPQLLHRIRYKNYYVFPRGYTHTHFHTHLRPRLHRLHHH